MDFKVYISTLAVSLSLLAGSTPRVIGAHLPSFATRQSPARHVEGQVHASAWTVLGQPSEYVVRVGRMVRWCTDLGLASRPRISGLKQIDRTRAVILTAYLAQRNPSACPSVETPVEYVVHIRHGLRGRSLYDGSKSPPIRRWPR